MKARVKETGEIIEVKEGTQIIFKDGSIGLGFITDNGEILNDYQLDFKDLTQGNADVKEKSLPKDATCRTCTHRVRYSLNEHSSKIIQCCELQPSKRSNSGYKTIKVTNQACWRYKKEE